MPAIIENEALTGTAKGQTVRIVADRRGAMLPFVAVGIMLMIGSVGAAVDIARVYIATSQMQAAVDAAALAGANAFDNDSATAPTGRQQQIISYFKDNFSDTFMGIGQPTTGTPIGGTATLLQPEFTTVNGISRTTVRASGMLPMTFMSIFGFGAKPISAVAKAEFQPHPLEIMTVLDNTGSMQSVVNGVRKIDALKNAMHAFVNVLYQGGSNPQPMLAMGIINYTNVANVGSILQQYSIPIDPMPGFTDQLTSWDSGNALAWKGCVANDETITNMSTDTAVREAAAYDIWNSLPGERPLPTSPRPMRAIRPHFSHPTWFPKNAAADKLDQDGDFYKLIADPKSNLYPDGLALAAVAQTSTYKRIFYRYYIGLNSTAAGVTNDVITNLDGSYYDPTAADAYNYVTGTGRDFLVRTSKIPNLSSYKTPNLYKLNSDNGTLPSPNWQCPEPGLPIKYDVSRSTYDSFIDNKVWAILPASGTVHHSGMIWGWRFLSRYQIFTRTPPAAAGTPVRALVFMTDGETAIAGDNKDRRLNFYGTLSDKTITTSDSDSAQAAASDLRFAKICAMANSTTFADSQTRPKIFVVALNKGSDIDTATQNRLKACGTSGYWLTTSSAEIVDAFTQIGRTLIDVHLTQ